YCKLDQRHLQIPSENENTLVLVHLLPASHEATMSKPTFSYGLSLSKKSTSSKPAPPKRKPVFGGDDDSDDDNAAASRGAPLNARGGFEEVQEVGGLDASLAIRAPTTEKPRKSKSKNAPPPTKPPTLKAKAATTTMFGDLSGSLTSRRNAEEGEKVD